jgi:hypothetical protein
VDKGVPVINFAIPPIFVNVCLATQVKEGEARARTGKEESEKIILLYQDQIVLHSEG